MINACYSYIDLGHILRLMNGRIEIHLPPDQWAAYKLMLLGASVDHKIIDLTPVVQDKKLPRGTAALFFNNVEVSRIENLAVPEGF